MVDIWGSFLGLGGGQGRAVFSTWPTRLGKLGIMGKVNHANHDMLNSTELWQAYKTARADLLAERTTDGHWEGRLASSALATATAIGALALVQQHGGPAGPETDQVIAAGLDWLARTQTNDGGWGDTERSPSNISTTMLVRAAVHLAGAEQRFAPLLAAAAQYIDRRGGLEGLRRRYGKDQTFAVPILTMYALAGLVRWEEVRPLPFEWAVVPHRLLGWVRLPVVSYAIPALVAMGQARFFHRPPRNLLLRWLRGALVEKTLQVLEAKQPASGGFLEAVPLTSFVLMALASTGRADHPVVQRGVDFLIRTYRPEGAWPIDANLAVWVTTLSLNALLRPGTESSRTVGNADSSSETILLRRQLARSCWPWILNCQHQKVHPFTASAPGGWGWTDLAGAVPDADDTSGALLALAGIYQQLQEELPANDRRRILQAVGLGLRWLLDLQNRDGGWPTFCRGWGALPFDRSATDLTAHALRALAAWTPRIARHDWAEAVASGSCPVSEQERKQAIQRGFQYLARSQNADGSWTPLWFGNAYWPGEENPVYGTARVLLAYRDLGQWEHPAAQRGRRWLLAHQNADGGWGGRPKQTHFPQQETQPSPPPSAPHPRPAFQDWQSSVEETALAVEALLADPKAVFLFRQSPEPADQSPDAESARLRSAVERGLAWLVRAIYEDRHRQPEPIGLYFARLWYYEKMYPTIYAVSALGEAVARLEPAETWKT